MQIVIPMTGEGARFKAAGYQTLKPLIPVHGIPILEYVAQMFPGDHSFLFICREDHEKEYDLRTYISSFCPKAEVVTIPSHKLGPVYAVVQAKDYIENDTPVMVSYCDYFMNWDFNDFIEKSNLSGEDGNVICYHGFHPHLLHKKNVYAGCRVNSHMQLLEIKEKFSFEEDYTKGYHSGGAYYFRSGQLLLKYFEKAIETNQSLNNEFYVSMVYPLMLQDNLRINVYEKVHHFCQWGTPEDLEEYLYWAEIFLNHNYQ